jgi:biotin synthase
VAARSSVQAAAASSRSFSTPVNDAFSPISTTPPPSPDTPHTLWKAVNARTPRYDWSKDEIREIYNTPLMELAHQAVGSRRLFERCDPDAGMTR